MSLRWLRLRTPEVTRRLNRRSRVQIIFFIGIGLAVLVASWQYSEAGGKWQDAVREELGEAFAVQENVRRVYGEEAPLAFEVAIAETRVAGLRDVRTAGRIAMSEYVVATRTEAQLRSRATEDSLVTTQAYAKGELGYDVLGRLADSLAALPAVTPGKTRASADLHAALGAAAAGAGIGLVVLATVASLIPRRRKNRPGFPRDDMIDLIPQPASTPGLRGPTALKLASWSLLAILPLSQLLLAAQEQQRQADAAISAVHISTAIFVSNHRNAFLINSRQAAITAEVQALARQFNALSAPTSADSAGEREVAQVETLLARRMKQMAEAMGRPARDDDRLDPAVVAALDSEPGDWPAALQEQNRHVALAQQASGRALRIITSTALAAMASALAATTTTGTAGSRRGRIASTIVMLAASVAIAVSGVWT